MSKSIKYTIVPYEHTIEIQFPGNTDIRYCLGILIAQAIIEGRSCICIYNDKVIVADPDSSLQALYERYELGQFCSFGEFSNPKSNEWQEGRV